MLAQAPLHICQMSPPTITLVEPRERSWYVTFDGPYDNTRPRHVELRSSPWQPWPTLATQGATLSLYGLRKRGQAIMWYVDGIFVDDDPRRRVHFTVHFGPRPVGQFEFRHPLNKITQTAGLRSCRHERGLQE